MPKLTIRTVLIGIATLALTGSPAGAHVRRINGQIAFDRFDEPDTAIYTVNPDGTHEQPLLAYQLSLQPPNECPTWSPDGSQIATCGYPDIGATALIDPDNGSYRVLAQPDPTLHTACNVWSPDARRLACDQAASAEDPSRNGIYSIRVSDGGGLTRITSNPGGHDTPGDYSPNGKQLVFARADSTNTPVGLFVVKVDGTGLEPITPPGTLLTSGVFGSWSPSGNEILFSRHVTADVHSTLWEVHADGTGLREINIPGVACGGANADPNGIGCFDPRWSPDGTKIVFGISGPDGKDAYTINADGTGLTRLTHDGDVDAADWGSHPFAP